MQQAGFNFTFTRAEDAIQHLVLNKL
jgi:hypothetical protein